MHSLKCLVRTFKNVEYILFFSEIFAKSGHTPQGFGQIVIPHSGFCQNRCQNDGWLRVCISNINIFRILIKIIPNIELTKLRYQ